MCFASTRHRFDSGYFQVFKTIKKEKKARILIEKYELEKKVLKYMILQTPKLLEEFEEFKNKRSDLKLMEDKGNTDNLFLEIKEILHEQYNSLPRGSSRSRSMNICPFTGRTRGYYNFVKSSRFQFKSLAGGGLIPGIRKAC